MDFEFTDDQVLLRRLIREFLSEQCPVSHVRAMMADPLGYDRALYRRLIQLGMLPFPEEYGGAGVGMVEQAIVLEEMGRIPYPGPYFATVILAGSVIMASNDQNAQARFLPEICTGEVTMSFAFLEEGATWGPEEIGLVLHRDSTGYRLRGLKRFVPFGQSVDLILVVARSAGTRGAEGLSLLAVPSGTPGLVIEPEVMMDLTAKTATLRFEDVWVPFANLIGEEGAAWPFIEVAVRGAAVGASAEMLGAARKALEMSVDYAKVRRQFGQYIGQFQAIKHKLAEMLELVENAHAAVYYAAWALDAAAPDAALAASVAKSTVNVAARRVCGEAIQVHGGIGFTWEYDLHLYFKRAKHLEPLYGDTDYHRERVLQEVLAGRVAGSV